MDDHSDHGRMVRAWQLAAAGLAGVGVYVLVNSRSHDYLDGVGPGGGFFPFWIGLFSVLTGVALFVGTTWRGLDRSMGWSRTARGPVLRILATVAALASAAILWEWLGFRISAFLMLVVLLRLYGARSWWWLVAFAAAASLLVFFTFHDLLQVPLPLGPFGI
ncbi:tripartite tricarboxylate transporter TctB family protein [Phytohabitans kaempferiae]|uniref:Tripartite tricarboxylate transporter TctB family protein n=1 Tax=Phytohabitans kaempferiae TaxID=1620943 RepID=A0ABV6MAF7_9ACTN